MSVPVQLEEVQAELARRGWAYFVTVGEKGRPHCVAVVPGWEGDTLVVLAGRSSLRNAAARGTATLVAPPVRDVDRGDGGGAAAGGAGGGGGTAGGAGGGGAAAGGPGGRGGTDGYSLIVDAEVTGTAPREAGDGAVHLRPLHAVLHRPAVAPDGGRGHDCLSVFDASPAVPTTPSGGLKETSPPAAT